MNRRIAIVMIVIGSKICLAQGDSLHIALTTSVCCGERGVMHINITSIDGSLYEVHSDQLISADYSKFDGDCKFDVGKLYFYVLKGDSTAQGNSSPHWFGFDDKQFTRKLKRQHLLQLPLKDEFYLPPAKYTLYLVYHSKQFGKCIRSNRVVFDVID